MFSGSRYVYSGVQSPVFYMPTAQGGDLAREQVRAQQAKILALRQSRARIRGKKIRATRVKFVPPKYGITVVQYKQRSLRQKRGYIKVIDSQGNVYYSNIKARNRATQRARREKLKRERSTKLLLARKKAQKIKVARNAMQVKVLKIAQIAKDQGDTETELDIIKQGKPLVEEAGIQASDKFDSTMSKPTQGIVEHQYVDKPTQPGSDLIDSPVSFGKGVPVPIPVSTGVPSPYTQPVPYSQTGISSISLKNPLTLGIIGLLLITLLKRK